MNTIPFTKMHGTGNDFVIVERDALGSVAAEEFARVSSRRHFGIGSDGLLVVDSSDQADICMRMYNPDGTQAMCGNGIRCFGRYVYERNIVPHSTMTVETIAGIKTLDVTLDSHNSVTRLRVDMGRPVFSRKDIPVAELTGDEPILRQKLEADGHVFTATILSMGNPHCVIFVDDLIKEEVIHYGHILESHPFFPERVNVEFVKHINSRHFEMNVYERGAGFTLSCGTGTCAAAVASHLHGYTEDTVTVDLPGGTLQVEYSRGDTVYMSGPAEFVYTGEYPF